MRLDNKALYEKIMRNVSKEVKRTLNEAAKPKIYKPRTKEELINLIIERCSKWYHAARYGNGSDRDRPNFSDIDTKYIKDMSWLFSLARKEWARRCPNEDYYGFPHNIDLSTWNTSKVENMEGMFAWIGFNYINGLDGFDTSKVKNMSFLFAGNESLHYPDIENWNVSNVQYMDATFMCDVNYYNVRYHDIFKTWLPQLKKLVSCRFLFYNLDSCKYFENITFNCPRLKSVRGMCARMHDLYSVENLTFNCPKLIDATGMIEGCSGLGKGTMIIRYKCYDTHAEGKDKIIFKYRPTKLMKTVREKPKPDTQFRDGYSIQSNYMSSVYQYCKNNPIT